MPTRLGLRARGNAPALYTLVDDLARHLGGPPVDRIVIGDSYNASASCYGLRRRRVLTIGLPIWAALGPQARVVLLGHELGHFVNGDPARSLLCQPALTTFARLATMVDPRCGGPRRPRSARRTFTDAITAGIWYIASAPVHCVLVGLQFAISSVDARASMRAEYLADALALELGGSTGANELLESIVAAERVRSAVVRAARTNPDPRALRAAADAARDRPERDRRIAAQHSVRVEASLFRSHPPSGLRARAVRGWGDPEPRFEIGDDLMGRIDDELAACYQRFSRVVTRT